MRYLLCLLFVISSAVAQPIEGPYEITTLDDDNFRSIGVGVRGEFVDVFFFADSVLYAAEFSIESQTITRSPHELRVFHDTSRLEIHDPIALNSEHWACLVYEDYNVDGNRSNMTYIFYGDHNAFSETLLDTGFTNANEPVEGQSWNSGFSLTPREGGGLIASWIEGVFNHIDADFSPRVCLLSESCEIDTIIGLENYDLNAYELNRAVFRSITHNNVAGSWGNFFYQAAMLWGNDETLGGNYYAALDCEFEALLNFGRTHAGALLAAYRFPSLPPLLMISRYDFDEFGLMTCANSNESSMLGDPVDSYWHPEYGFAVLSEYNVGMGLARIDTTLNDVQPPGGFYQGGYIRNYDLTISDSGDVFVLWTEENLYSGETALRLASVGWDVFLDTDNPSQPTIPESFTLSAYPNPFNSTVKLAYELPTSSEINLSIYNIAGQKVATLVNEQVAAGHHETNWSPDVASGVYFALLTTSTVTKSTKLLYLR